MKKYQINSSIIPNINELDELPIIKKQMHTWFRFKQKQKYLPLLRSISYHCKQTMSKIFVFDIVQQKKDKKISRTLQVYTEKEIISLQQLYQILNQNMTQKQFSQQVQKIKTFQKSLYNYITSSLAKNLITFLNKTDFITCNIYKQNQQFYIKGAFSDYNYQVELCQQTRRLDKPLPYKICNSLVKEKLAYKYQQLIKMSGNIPICQDIHKVYIKFYDSTYFFYDQFVLRLQVFNNYPNLRLKNFVPVKFKDYKTQQPLEGPIFSNAEGQCMYGHFIGYNANSIRLLEGQYCQICQLLIEQLQENELLMILRDNILNPQKSDIFYNPQHNRFKLLSKNQVIRDVNEEMNQEKVFYKTSIGYLNYSHFRINLKKLTNKNRLTFYNPSAQQSFSLSFNILNRSMLILDPARGKQCQHYTFTDLRLYYLNYDPVSNLYTCPVSGCGQRMTDGDILYLKQVTVLIDYAKFKCEQCLDLIDCSKVVIDHSKKKLYVLYKVRQQGIVLSKMDELVDFYKTLVDPFIPFPEYSLGIKQKQRKKKMEQRMFGGWQRQMEAQQEIQQQEDDQIYQS